MMKTTPDKPTIDREYVIKKITDLLKRENSRLKPISESQYQWWDNPSIKAEMRDNNKVLKYIKENLK